MGEFGEYRLDRITTNSVGDTSGEDRSTKFIAVAST